MTVSRPQRLVVELPGHTGMTNYKVPGILAVPVRLGVVVVEFPGDDVPFGAKGVDDTGTFPVSPAVANTSTKQSGSACATCH